MTHWTEATDLLDEPASPGPGVLVRYAPGALAFALSAALGGYLVYVQPLMRPSPQASVAAPEAAEANPFGALMPVAPPPAVALTRAETNPFGDLVLKGFGSSDRLAKADESAPLPPTPPADLRAPQDDSAPLPPRRPSALARVPLREDAPDVARTDAAPAAPATPAGPGIFEKLFGGNQGAKAPEATLAYAAPPPVSGAGSAALAGRGGQAGGGGGFGGFLRNLSMGSSPASRFGDHVAVYDISARMVYLPDGTKLEAHSGLGLSRDDPNSISERMRGVTPPATYALTPRETLFHGVAALRLTPIDSNVFGRAGLLAHTYMLGPDGDSNGCVSFRDYDAFLNAYRSGQITKLVVVTRL